MRAGLLRLILSAFVLAAPLAFTAPAFADPCKDAQDAEDAARKALAEALAAMKQMDFVAKTLAGTPFEGLAQQAAKDATDKWLDANKDYLKKRTDADKCKDKPPTVEGTGGSESQVSGHGVTGAGKVNVPIGDFGTGTPGLADVRFGSGAFATGAGQGSSFGGLRVSAVGEVEFAHVFGSTLPSFLGGLRGTALLTNHPKVQPFGEILFGIEHCGECQTNDFALEFGLGMVYERWERLGIVGEISFRKLPGVQFGETETRLVGGISYRLFR
jgi:hypothetical protein